MMFWILWSAGMLFILIAMWFVRLPSEEETAEMRAAVENLRDELEHLLHPLVAWLNHKLTPRSEKKRR